MLFCCLQLVITVICQMTSSAATSIYAQGDIKWYAIYKSVMNLLPILVTYLAYSLGGAPYWSYIAMIVIWATGGDIVVAYYASKLSGLAISDLLKGVVAPVVCVAALMAAIGYLPQLFIQECFLRLLLSCMVTSVIFCLLVWQFVFRSQERCMVVSMLKSRFC